MLWTGRVTRKVSYWVLYNILKCTSTSAMHALILWVGPPLMVRPMSCLMDIGGHIPHTREGLLLSCRGLWLFLDRLIGGGDGGGLSTALSPQLRSGGLESKFGWGPGPHDKRVMGWSCLCLGYKRGVCFWGIQLGALIRESPGNLVCLIYGLAP